MNDADLRTKLTAVFRDVFDDDAIAITDATTAKDIEAWDSFNHVNLIVAVQQVFAIKISTREATTLANVGELVVLIRRKLGP